MRQRFLPGSHPEAARLIAARCAHADVYAGVVLGQRRLGGRDALGPADLCFVEIDVPDALARIELYPPADDPRSHRARHLHAYWALAQPVGPERLEHANRRLAHHLGGDPASVDAARILRPPATLNHKHNSQPPSKLRELVERRLIWERSCCSCW
jgi:hypothetical protein